VSSFINFLPVWPPREIKRGTSLCNSALAASTARATLRPVQLIDRPILEPEVAAALAVGRPVVALESTIIAHGFPRPDNHALAVELQEAVRANGAVPAVIAVVDGSLHCGLSDALLDRLANSGDFAKCAARDVPVALATGKSGATTVSATMLAAALAGIEVFATGGIGGVHRGAGATFDESADLHALARWPVLVVSAGAKAILDLPKTMQRLESLNVPVIGFCCDKLPAFYTRASSADVSHRADSVQEVVNIWQMRRSMGGMLVANPIPATDEIPAIEVQAWISAALACAADAGVAGREVTPFLLADLAKRSAGRAVAANRALALNNAVIAAQIAAQINTGAKS
jgi:pseudouridylate synthase